MLFNEQGLTSEEVLAKQKEFGLNVLPEKPPPSKVFLIFQQLRSPLVYVLLISAIVTSILGHFSDTIIILIAVLINTILGFVQENKASNALFALRHFETVKATAIREGKRVLIDASQIVPGDLIVLNQGAKIPADGVLTFANRLYINEAILTGESAPAQKSKNDEVFMGTTISAGQGLMIVNATGSSTKMGKIAGQIQEKEEDTPLQKQLKGFSRQLVAVIGILTTIVFLLGILYEFDIREIFSTSVALAVSSIPEGLLVSLTVVLSVGMQKILKHRGLVKKMSAAETLGGVSMICVDKTGTLTEGQMKVVDFVGDKAEIAKQIFLANDLDDPIVIAAYEWAKSQISDLSSGHKRLDSLPFSSKERFFASLHQWTENHNMIFVNGAPDILLRYSSLSTHEKEKYLKKIDELTAQGKRLLGFARKTVPLNQKQLTTDDAKNGLSWIGILAFSDPVRKGAKEAIEKATAGGIKTIVITGDYSKTSEFVLSAMGIHLHADQIMTGEELNQISAESLAEKVKTIRLFARTTPDQKLLIVEACKRNGEIVAMMGDGVNDAPALHKADIGIVVENATDVAKESSDLILLDSNFSTITSAIQEGRLMFENIRKIILYLMSDAFAEILVVILSIAFGLPLPLTAVQILWINLVSDGFPNLALTIDPVRQNIMKEKPRSPGERLVNGWMISLIGCVSLVAGGIALFSFIFVYNQTHDLTTARSMAFATLGLNSLIYVFSVRSLMSPFWKNSLFNNRWLILAVFAGLLLQIFPFSTSALRNFFGLNSLEATHWLFAGASSVAMFFVVEIFKFVYLVSSKKVK